MSENSKYENILSDLTLIESEVRTLVEMLKVTTNALKEKELQNAMLKQDIQKLNKRLTELEYEIEHNKLNSQFKGEKIQSVDNELLKQKIKYLISRIDLHLSS